MLSEKVNKHPITIIGLDASYTKIQSHNYINLKYKVNLLSDVILGPFQDGIWWLGSLNYPFSSLPKNERHNPNQTEAIQGKSVVLSL